MHEFENFVYLDVQKTGSTTIRKFFRKFAASEAVADDKHAPVDEKKPGKILYNFMPEPAQAISIPILTCEFK